MVETRLTVGVESYFNFCAHGTLGLPENIVGLSNFCLSFLAPGLSQNIGDFVFGMCCLLQKKIPIEHHNPVDLLKFDLRAVVERRVVMC